VARWPGFGSLASFRRQFGRLTGTTPRAYRQTFKGDDSLAALG
jgi:transcriptional regulator GlxA family with amidase domain